MLSRGISVLEDAQKTDEEEKKALEERRTELEGRLKVLKSDDARLKGLEEEEKEWEAKRTELEEAHNAFGIPNSFSSSYWRQSGYIGRAHWHHDATR